MDELKKKDVLHTVAKYYLESHDFNGIPTCTLSEKYNQDWDILKNIVRELIEDEMVVMIDTNTDENPHIIRIGYEPKDIQILKLNGDSSYHACIYPTSKHLNSVVSPEDFAVQPYKLCLELGEAQLSYRSFDLSVLEFYRNDPRYNYENDDIQGSIYYNTEEIKDSDKVLLETFGFSYDEEYNRAVAVFLRYLKNLTPEHQQIWKAKELNGNFKLHPDYYRNSIIGDWGEKEPICSAFLTELHIINQMSKAMGRPSFFKNDFGNENRPRHFGFLIRPTLGEFNNFILLFDKMISDNLNQDFFQKEVLYENEIKRKDGKIIVHQKGTLQILDEWIRKFFKTNDWKLWEESISTLRKIRKMRQSPAHLVNEDQFDQKYFKEQRDILISAYSAVKTLRLMFANHPRVKRAKILIPDWLHECKIWTM